MTDTSTVSIPLDVMSKYQALVKESLGGDSIYIRAKETIDQLFLDNSINSNDKAQAVSSIIGGMVSSITSSSMATALEWSKYEKELALKKLELDQQLLILGQEKLLKEAQVDQVTAQTRSALVESRRLYGTGTFDVSTGALLSLSEDGKVWGDMQLTVQQVTNAGIEETLLGSKVKESKVAIHKVVADTFVNFGAYEFTYGAGEGISTVTKTSSNVTLSDTQKSIAVEQGKGYTYNAWANALTGSASMLGTAIASGDFDFSSGSSGDILIRTIINCANNLATSSGNSADAVPVDKVTVPANIV